MAGTRLLKDINPGPSPTYQFAFVVAGDEAFFVADDGPTGYELWSTDGSTAGTVRVSDINPGTASAYPANLHWFGNRLLFSADNGLLGQELWVVE